MRRPKYSVRGGGLVVSSAAARNVHTDRIHTIATSQRDRRFRLCMRLSWSSTASRCRVRVAPTCFREPVCFFSRMLAVSDSPCQFGFIRYDPQRNPLYDSCPPKINRWGRGRCALCCSGCKRSSQKLIWWCVGYRSDGVEKHDRIPDRTRFDGRCAGACAGLLWSSNATGR